MTQVEVPKIFVHPHPGQIPEGALRGGVAIVVDVLRATTSMAHALASGCREIIPCAEIEEARAVADCVIPAGTAVLAGERGGLPIEGFDLGNSPEEFTPEACRDRTIVMTTSNGTRAILASLEADDVYVASFVNLAATVEDLVVQFLKKGHRHPIHVVCAGDAGRPTIEDILCAGGLAKLLVKRSFDVLMTEEASVGPRFARWIDVENSLDAGDGENLPDEQSAFQSYARCVLGAEEESSTARGAVRAWRDAIHDQDVFLELLRASDGGKRLQEIGREADIDAAARLDSLDVVGKLGRKPTRISRV